MEQPASPIRQRRVVSDVSAQIGVGNELYNDLACPLGGCSLPLVEERAIQLAQLEKVWTHIETRLNERPEVWNSAKPWGRGLKFKKLTTQTAGVKHYPERECEGTVDRVEDDRCHVVWDDGTRGDIPIDDLWGYPIQILQDSKELVFDQKLTNPRAANLYDVRSHLS
mgnify:CR=1 FL=1